ncbi:glutamate receptor ionotropic, NMDA 1-like isoform X2 [Lineus longissimus]|uniref:glutamate receptor ionotropic, NMDA 1-like isoform X2 n=2 Tax=Lineus longissimus TaxID=88925 RepID=UPI00315DD70E
MDNKFVFLFALTFCAELALSKNPTTITIGGVLSSKRYVDEFHDAVRALNTQDETRLTNVVYNSTGIVMEDNQIRSAMAICKDLIPQKVFAVVVSHPPNSFDQAPFSVSYTCGFYKIPVIGITARDSVFSDMNLHESYLRTVPPYSDQASVWVDLIRHFKWKSVVIMHSADQNGRALVARFQNELDIREEMYGSKNTATREKEKITISKLIDFKRGEMNFFEQLTFNTDTRVILLSSSGEDAESIFRDAATMNMTEGDFVWIVTEQVLEAKNVPAGTIGVQLKSSREESYHIKDAVRIIGNAYNKAFKVNNITDPPSGCEDKHSVWPEGSTLYQSLIDEKLDDGLTGKVRFNDLGDRLMPIYEIINVEAGNKKVVVGTYANNSDRKVLQMNADTPVVWPDGSTVVPKGIKITTHLRVVTIESVPFVFNRSVNSKEDCQPNEIFCPRPNGTDPAVEDAICCSGYCIDMLRKIAEKVNFTYDVHLVSDGQFGSPLDKDSYITGSSSAKSSRHNNNKKAWNGMMGEVLTNMADLIVAPMTITPERARDIDFTKPFKYQGLTILVRKEEKNSNLASFLQPFQDTLWILVGLSVHVVALVLYLLDRFSPFGRFKLARSSDTEEDALNLSSAMWFAWGVLLNSGIGEGTPRSFSARVLGMVWAGFAMIIVASYTANLAAFLVLDRPEASISGIDDARLRNPQDEFRYATIKNSAVELYFKRQVELSTMYRTMEEFEYKRPEDAIKDVKDKKLQAFIWDSSRLEYEAARDCDLVTAGEMFGRSGFGIGMRKESPWLNEISLEILSLHETGFMEKLDTKWILVPAPDCPQNDQSPATLGLTNMAGVFMLVAGGILTGVFLIFVEILYKRHRGLKEKELELARNAADRWRGNIEIRRARRAMWSKFCKEGHAQASQVFPKLPPKTPHAPLKGLPNAKKAKVKVPKTSRSAKALPPALSRDAEVVGGGVLPPINNDIWVRQDGLYS